MTIYTKKLTDPSREPSRSVCRARFSSALLGVAAFCAVFGGLSTAAFASKTISVSSTAYTLGAGGPALTSCTLRDALVVADEVSNPDLRTAAELAVASQDCCK